MFVFNTVYPIGGHPDLITFLFGFSGISIGFGLTYLIWSLIQKKVNTDDKTLNTEK